MTNEQDLDEREAREAARSEGVRMPHLAAIVEVATCSKRKVNVYLQAGYKLLAVEPESVWAKAPKDAGKVAGYVLRFVTFIVGRTADVPHFEPGKSD